MEKSRNKGMDLEYIKGMNLLRNSVSTINKYDWVWQKIQDRISGW